MAIYAPIVQSTVISFELTPPSTEEMAARITERLPRYPWLVAEDDAADILGYAYASRYAPRAAYDWSVETSIYVAEHARGQGLGRLLYADLFDRLAQLGYRQAMAGATLPNPASAALHESVGFTLVGVYRAVGWKFGQWHDVGWWQRPLGDGADSPPG